MLGAKPKLRATTLAAGTSLVWMVKRVQGRSTTIGGKRRR
jgi:hypothetical protein